MQRKRIIQILAFFLLLLFSLMQVAAALHVHANHKEHHSFASSKTSSKHFVAKVTAKCRVCEFHHHRMPDFAAANKPVSFKCMVTELRSLKINFTQQIFEAAVHTWTNKGPPVSLLA